MLRQKLALLTTQILVIAQLQGGQLKRWFEVLMKKIGIHLHVVAMAAAATAAAAAAAATAAAATAAAATAAADEATVEAW